MDTLIKDIRQLIIDWPVWRLTAARFGDRTVILSRTDGEPYALHIAVDPQYPTVPSRYWLLAATDPHGQPLAQRRGERDSGRGTSSGANDEAGDDDQGLPLTTTDPARAFACRGRLATIIDEVVGHFCGMAHQREEADAAALALWEEQAALHAAAVQARADPLKLHLAKRQSGEPPLPSDPSEASIEAGRQALLRAAAAMNGTALCDGCFLPIAKVFVVEIGVALRFMHELRCKALGVDASSVLVARLLVPLGFDTGEQSIAVDRVTIYSEEEFNTPMLRHRRRLERFVASRAPALASAVEQLLMQHAGKEELLFEFLTHRYKPEPESAAAWGPLQWFLRARLQDAATKNQRMLRHGRSHGGVHDHGLAALLFKFPEECFYQHPNVLFGLRRCLTARLSTCTTVCLVCDEHLGFAGVKMGICNRPLCRHTAEHYGISTNVAIELLRNPLVCELLVSLTFIAAKNGAVRDTLDPMCPIHLDADRAQGGPRHFFVSDYNSGEKNFELLADTLTALPSIPDMAAKANGSNQALREQLQSINPLCFPLLQWVIASNRAHLEPIPEALHIAGLGAHQFYLVSSNPEKERRFRAALQKAKESGSDEAESFFAWHGSAPGNWHCILRGGLRNYSGTKLMSYGQVYGSGIYLASTMATSVSYMGQPAAPFPQAALIPSSTGLSLISLCEVVNAKTGWRDHGNNILTVQDEDIVSTRFLFVFPAGVPARTAMHARSLNIPKELLRVVREEF